MKYTDQQTYIHKHRHNYRLFSLVFSLTLFFTNTHSHNQHMHTTTHTEQQVSYNYAILCYESKTFYLFSQISFSLIISRFFLKKLYEKKFSFLIINIPTTKQSKINNQQEEVSGSLIKYNKEIESLKREMDRATLSATRIRSDNENTKLRYFSSLYLLC